jgi:lysophospholipase L1-like esterase
MVKRRRLLAGLVAGVALLGTAVVATGVAGAESNGGVRVMPLGDSITDGFNVPGGYRIELWQKLVAGGYTVDFVGSQYNGPADLGDHDHQGHSGWWIHQIDANIVTWLQATTPRTVLLHIGTNDIINNSTGAPDRLATLIDHITSTAPNAEVFVATIVTLSANDAGVRAYNAAIPGIVQTRAAAGRRVHLVDMYSALTTADLADGIHPNAGGYAKMATVWYNALRSVPGSLTNGTATPTGPTASPTASVTPRPTTPPPTTPPPITPTPGQGTGCTATYRNTGSWGGGFQAEVTVGNTGASTLNGWTVRLTLAGGQSIVNLWNGTNTGTSGAISVRNASYNGTVAANASTAFGFVAQGDPATAPTGVSCSSP